MSDYIKQGWVRFYRKSMDSTVWKNPNIWFVWSWCLLKANHKNTKIPFNGEDIELFAGQFISGRNKALEELPLLTSQQWRTAIDYLKSTNRIAVNSNNKFSIITILNWNEHQSDNHQSNQPVTNQQPASNQPVTTDKNDKNDKNDNLSEASSLSELKTKSKEIKKKQEDIELNKKAIKFIEIYAGIKKVEVNKGFQSRHIKIAKEVLKYPKNKISASISYCKENYEDWGMETIIKVIEKGLI